MRVVYLVLTAFLVGCAAGSDPTRLLLPDGRGGYSFINVAHPTAPGAIDRSIAEKVKLYDVCKNGYDVVDVSFRYKYESSSIFDVIVACR